MRQRTDYNRIQGIFLPDNYLKKRARILVET